VRDRPVPGAGRDRRRLLVDVLVVVLAVVGVLVVGVDEPEVLQSLTECRHGPSFLVP
jgi:hypothetical protein